MSLTFLELSLEGGNFMEHLLEPQLVGLVNDDKKHLVVLAIAEWLLEFEKLVDLQVRDIGDCFFAHVTRLPLSSIFL